MGLVRSYRDLTVWRKSMDLAVGIYGLTRGFPAEERYGLTAQMRRAASSIAANIAEGWARRTTGEFVQALSVARGSLAELETFPHLTARLEMIDEKQAAGALDSCAEIHKMLNALAKSLGVAPDGPAGAGGRGKGRRQSRRRLPRRQARPPNPQPLIPNPFRAAFYAARINATPRTLSPAGIKRQMREPSPVTLTTPRKT